MSETLEIFGREYTGVTGIKAKDDNGNLVTFIKPEGTLNVSQNGTVDVSQYAIANVNVSGGGGGSMPLGTAESIFVFANLGLTWDNSAEENVT